MMITLAKAIVKKFNIELEKKDAEIAELNKRISKLEAQMCEVYNAWARYNCCGTLEELAEELQRSPKTIYKNWYRTVETFRKKGIIIMRWGRGNDIEYEVEYEERDQVLKSLSNLL